MHELCYCRAAAGIRILEADAFFQAKYRSLGDGLGWVHFCAAAAYLYQVTHPRPDLLSKKQDFNPFFIDLRELK